MAKILAVDDDAAILRLVRKMLSIKKHEVTTLQSIKDITIEELNKYNLILLDVMMPDEDGFKICEKIRSLIDIPIIFMTAKSDESSIIKGLSIGGDDYIVKPFSIHEVNARIEAHLRREARPKKGTKSVFIDGDILIDLEAKKVMIKGEEVSFTKTQYKICELLALHKGKIFSKEDIYESVYSIESDSQISTVVEHIRVIRKKIAQFNLAPISTVWGVGYIWE
ncbi:response regulator transcription factor [Bacillus sonorensis]|uniref:Two-component response regulator n=2 Tax=Bacillus sonorensis TaxID=119858 RepID=M5NZP4_9BACI|nr:MULTISPECIES: response regulator transcription factor [Bacillus]TWK74020.1 Response regulator ArlR [Bacillus paralicheniformis]ASB91320.1 Transcriptional regulatory protein CpxR like protein [Bacillus sonorensis]EME72643.1 two-component response regulator [Bacillus sonorensis L12]MBG9917343.1 transcriptional regulatory protein SpaR [Bacillus sonorensis]MCY7857207.1 response regulator transcription factor [Bacillus sonorensis]